MLRVPPLYPFSIPFGQALDLLDVEDGVAFHEGDCAFGLLAGLAVGFGANDLVGVHDKASVLALAHIGLEFERLLEGHPDGCCIPFLDRFRPQHQDIDALIGYAVGPQRTHDAPFPIAGAPWFQLGPDAALKIGHDPVGDFPIDVGSHWLAFLARLRMQPARPTPMSGGLAVKTKKRGSGAGRSAS